MNQENKQVVRHVEVGEDHNGQRLDNFLTLQLKGVPKSHIYKILRKGEVRVNKSRAKPSYKLQVGDNVRIPPVRITPKEPLALSAQTSQLNQLLAAAVLLETDDFVVLNKPSGLAVHGGSGLRYGLIEVLKAGNDRFAQLELVHRLDRGTSGCLLLAKNRHTLKALHALLREHAVEKTYTTLLAGQLAAASMQVDAALLRNTVRSGERMVAISEEGKEAKTHIQRLQQYAQATLAQVQIDTGRTHQIRVHTASIGHPLAGDEKYGDREFNKAMRQLGLKRLFLHASGLRFTLDQTYVVEAALPPELQALLDTLNAT